MPLRRPILLVHREAEMMHPLQSRLVQEGYRVFYTGDTANTLRHVYRIQPELVILEVSGSAARRWDTLQRLRGLSEVRVLALSAAGDEADCDKSRAMGADDCLREPFAVDTLVASVNALMRRAAQAVPADSSTARAGSTLVPLPQPLKCLTPSLISQIDEILSMLRSRGEVRLMKNQGRLRQISLVQPVDGE